MGVCARMGVGVGVGVCDTVCVCVCVCGGGGGCLCVYVPINFPHTYYTDNHEYICTYMSTYL